MAKAYTCMSVVKLVPPGMIESVTSLASGTQSLTEKQRAPFRGLAQARPARQLRYPAGT